MPAKDDPLETIESPVFSEWYMSFADSSGFLGGVVVIASDAHQMMTVAHMTGLNPGGEVQYINLTKVGKTVPYEWRFRLLTADEAAYLPVKDLVDAR